MTNHVFLSYRHESPQHAREVRRLGELLRQAGICVELDQFYLDGHPGGPDEGWPKWCEDRAAQSACVVIVPSPGWFAAYEGTGPADEGRGAASEAGLFRQYFHDQKDQNSRIRLAFVEPLPADCPIPPRLRAWHQFHPLSSPGDLDQLVAWLASRLGSPGIQSPTVRWPDPQIGFVPDFANRHCAEWPAVVDLLSGRSRERILMLESESGYGKSEFVHQAAAYATCRGVAVAKLDFKAPYSDLTALLAGIAVEIGDQLPDFQQGGNKPHLLQKDLRALRQPVLMTLDSYEKAAGLADWVCQCLLPEVERSLGLAVIIAGHTCPDSDDFRWRGLVRRFRFGPISDPAHWEQWLARRHPDFQKYQLDVRTLVLASGGVPKTFSDMCKIIAQGSCANT